MRNGEFVQSAVVLVIGVCSLALGLWAFFAPLSFYENIAEFPPYNRHLVHDIGAFMIGLGAALLFALVWRGDAILAVLLGAAAGWNFHFAAHIIDSDLGGRGSDPYTLGVIAVVVTLAAIWRLADRLRGDRPGA